MSHSNQTQATRPRTRRWAWVIVLGTPVVALVLAIYPLLLRPEFETSSKMQLDEEWMVSFLPVPHEEFIHRLEAPNFSDCNGDGLPEIGFRAYVHYRGIYGGKWSFLNFASTQFEEEWRAYSIWSGEEVLHLSSVDEDKEKLWRSDGTFCLHPIGKNSEAACTASESCRDTAFPSYWRTPRRVQIEGRQYSYDPWAEDGRSWIVDLATGDPVFTEAEYSQTSSTWFDFGEIPLLGRGLLLGYEAEVDGSPPHALVYRFHPQPAVKKYPLPNHCAPKWTGFGAAGVVNVDPDGSVVFLAGIELPRPDEQGEPVLPLLSELIEVKLGEEAVVRTIFDLSDDLNTGAIGAFSAAAACRGSAFYFAPIEVNNKRGTSGFLVRTPWQSSAVTITLPSWLPESRMASPWAKVLPDLDGDGLEECLFVFEAWAFPEDNGLVALIVSGATGQLVRRDAVQLPTPARK
jgi:hypothetical protein